PPRYRADEKAPSLGPAGEGTRRHQGILRMGDIATAAYPSNGVEPVNGLYPYKARRGPFVTSPKRNSSEIIQRQRNRRAGKPSRPQSAAVSSSGRPRRRTVAPLNRGGAGWRCRNTPSAMRRAWNRSRLRGP